MQGDNRIGVAKRTPSMRIKNVSAAGSGKKATGGREKESEKSGRVERYISLVYSILKFHSIHFLSSPRLRELLALGDFAPTNFI